MNNEYLIRARKKISDPQILCVVAARRAKQLATGGARPMVKCDSEQFLDIALLEIAEGLLTYEFPEDAVKAAREALGVGAVEQPAGEKEK